MRMWNKNRFAHVVALGLLAAACSLDPPYKTWEPLNYAELEQAMAEPTGKLSELDPAELLEDIPVYVAALVQTVALFDRIRELTKRPTADGGMTDGGMTDGGMTDSGMTDGGMTDGGMTDGGMTDSGMTDGGMTDGGMTDGGALDAGTPDAPVDLAPAADPSPGASEEGTSVYFKLACPGPEPIEGQRDFEFGNFRIDSPALQKSDINTFAVHGHLLLTYDKCQTVVGTLTGESPAYFDLRYNWLGLRLLLSIKDGDEEVAPPVDIGTIVDSTGYRLLLQDAQDDTFVLSVLIGDDDVKVSLAGADGEVGCEYTEDPPAINCGTL